MKKHSVFHQVQLGPVFSGKPHLHDILPETELGETKYSIPCLTVVDDVYESVAPVSGIELSCIHEADVQSSEGLLLYRALTWMTWYPSDQRTPILLPTLQSVIMTLFLSGMAHQILPRPGRYRVVLLKLVAWTLRLTSLSTCSAK